MQNDVIETITGAVSVGITLIFAPVLRIWYNKWGATSDEITGLLPGDELVPNPKLHYTRAITIHAPASKIWPWLAQLGQGRGGLYSYDRLENLAGCDIHSADRIIPEFQDLKVGDPILFGPAEKNYPGQIVAAIEPGHAVIMHALNPATREAEKSYSWALVLQEQSDGTTRLISRARNGYTPGLGNHLVWHMVEPINFVMERKMMKGIKQRVEAAG